MAGLFSNRHAFNLVASAYDLLTQQEIWARQSCKVLAYVPSETTVRRVLDIGCGPGGSTFALAAAVSKGTEVIGVDYAGEMIRRARRHHAKHYAQFEHLQFQEGDATQLPFDDDSFDLIVGHSFLYLVQQPQEVLQELRRVLHPSGTLVFMEPHEGGTLRAAVRARFGLEEETKRFTLQTLRFWTSMVTWRWVSTAEGRWQNDTLVALFNASGFEQVAIYPTLGGLGVHCVATPIPIEKDPLA